MGWYSVVSAIEQRLTDNWQSMTAVALPNTPFSLPESDPWIRVCVVKGAGEQVDMNPAPRIRNVGTIVVQVFARVATGLGQIDRLTDLLSPIFDRVQFSGIQCRAHDVHLVGERDGWCQQNVSWPFYWDEISQ